MGGYTGGEEQNPTYQNIKDATEAYLIEFDPTIISYEQILNDWAEQALPYYPTKRQYRSAIFVTNEEQRQIALNKIDEMKGKTNKKIYAQVETSGTFYQAEEYHQDFLEKQRA